MGDLQKKVPSSMLRGAAFGCVMLASSALNNLFVTYHLDFFMNSAKLEPAYFYGAQLVFMVWNATNDVIFGWLSDTMPISQGTRSRRLVAIRWGGLCWAFAFLVAWFPWGTNPALVGLNFMFNLCLYGNVPYY